MEVDTGAAVSIVSEKLYNSRFKKHKLQPCDVVLRTYSAQPIQLLGQLEVKVKCGTQVLPPPLLVSKGKGPTLMGRNWIQQLKLDWSRVNYVSDPVAQLCDKYAAVFSDQLGVVKGVKAKIQVSEKAVPKFCKARPVPYALREAVDKQLTELEKQGVFF